MNYWRKRREKIGISQRRLAGRLGVSNNAVSVWEQDGASPSSTIADLAVAYETTQTEIERELIRQRRRIEANRRQSPPRPPAAGNKRPAVPA